MTCLEIISIKFHKLAFSRNISKIPAPGKYLQVHWTCLLYGEIPSAHVYKLQMQ